MKILHQFCIKKIYICSFKTDNKLINDLKRGNNSKQSASFLFSVSDEDIIYSLHRTGDSLIYRLLLAEIESPVAHCSNSNSG